MSPVLKELEYKRSWHEAKLLKFSGSGSILSELRGRNNEKKRLSGGAKCKEKGQRGCLREGLQLKIPTEHSLWKFPYLSNPLKVNTKTKKVQLARCWKTPDLSIHSLALSFNNREFLSCWVQTAIMSQGNC